MLIVGEMIRLARLALRVGGKTERPSGLNWPTAVRLEILKWGIFGSMFVFTITLIDAYADLLIAVSFSIWILVTWHFRPKVEDPETALRMRQ